MHSMINLTATEESTMETLIQYNISPSFTIIKEENVLRYLYTHVYSTIIHNNQEVETNQMSSDRWINKMWYIHTMEYYSALKRNEILT